MTSTLERTPAAKMSATARMPARLQRKCACGGTPGPTGECEQCKRKRLALQTKLRINQPGDHYEQEADRAAARVTNESVVSASRTALGKSSGVPAAGEAPEIVHEVLASGGQPLGGKTVADMSARFGHDFGRVRVHTDARAAESARALSAHAYTVGPHIAFDSGRYAPETTDGGKLLAHELTHVMQQSGGATATLQRQPAAPGKTAEKPEEGGKQNPSPSGAIPLAEVLPFAPGKIGHAVGWDGATILAKGQIDPTSDVGKAVSDGPKAVRELSSSLYEQLLAEIGKERKFYAYFRAVLEAAGASSLLMISIGMHMATYGMLRNFARLTAALATSGTKRRKALLTWAATPTPETGVVGSAPPEPVGLRQHIIAQLDFWAGATEGEKAPEGEAKFEEFRGPKTLESARQAKAKEGRTYTTCVEFLGFALERAASESKSKPKVALTQLNANLVFEENRKKLPQGAWHDAKPKMSERPKPGDFYVMMFAEDVYEQKQDPKTQEWKKEKTHGKDEFSHIGYVRSISKNPRKEGETAETETWETVDGGAGLAGRYKYEQVADKDDPKKKVDTFTLLKQGAEKIELFSRLYIPETNIFPGGVANQSPGKRYLLGWIDVDYIV